MRYLPWVNRPCTEFIYIGTPLTVGSTCGPVMGATHMDNQHPLLAASDAAKILGVTPATVRLMQKRGELPATTKTASGMHLYQLADVKRLAAKRAKNRPNGGR